MNFRTLPESYWVNFKIDSSLKKTLGKIGSIKKKKIGFPGSSDSKESAYNVGDPGSIPGSERSPGEENGNLLQYSCLENSVDRRAWWATVYGVAKSLK